MFARAKAWQSYRQVATQTASPGQVVLMLYDGILRFREQARSSFSNDDPKEFNEAINNNLQRAQAIINEMNQVPEHGGRRSAWIQTPATVNSSRC